MGARSRNKGKLGECELAAYLSARGYPAQRGQQHRGAPGSPDVICETLPIHWEVKRCEALRINEAIAQAIADAANGKRPVVAHRRNRGEWLAIMRLDDLLSLFGEGFGRSVRAREARLI